VLKKLPDVHNTVALRNRSDSMSTPVFVKQASARSCELKKLPDVQSTEGQKCPDEHTSLILNLRRSSGVQTLERLKCLVEHASLDSDKIW